MHQAGVSIRGQTLSEFDVSEGDAYNKVLVNQGKTRLERLGFFDVVTVTTRQGSSPDRIVIVVTVVDKATGEFAIGGGYSSNGGAIAEISFLKIQHRWCKFFRWLGEREGGGSFRQRD